MSEKLNELKNTGFKENDVVQDVLSEMATVGTDGQYKYSVYTEPMGNPSFHLRHKTDFEIVLTVSDYKILEVKFNYSRYKFKKGEYPPKEIINQIEDFMGKKNKKYNGISNNDALFFAWKLLNED